MKLTNEIAVKAPWRAAFRDAVHDFAAKNQHRFFSKGITAYDIFVQIVMLLVLVLVLYPIARMVLRTFIVDGQFKVAAFSVVQESWFLPMLASTLVVIGLSTALAVTFGAMLAWLNERTDAHLGVMGTILPVIPLIIPGIALAIGWIFLAAPRVGFLNGALANLPLIGYGGLGPLNIYSWGGLIWLYFIYGVPYAYLISSAAFRNMDPALEEASRVSGAGILRTLRRVSLPSIRPALISSALVVVIAGLGTYSVPVIVATNAKIDLLSLRLVRLLKNTFPPNLAEAQVLGAIMLIIVGVLWLVQRRIAGGGKFLTAGGRASSVMRLPLGVWRGPARAVMIGYMAATSIIPMMALLIVALQPFWSPKINVYNFTLTNFYEALFINNLTIVSLRNSLVLSAVAASIAMIISTVAAIELARKSGFRAQLVDGVIKLPATIPTLVTAVAFLITFAPAPFSLSGTLLLLLMAFVIIHMPPGSIAANSAISQVGKDLREASYISGAGEGRTVRRIVIPLALPGLLAGWTLVFVQTVGDINASALLAGPNNPVVGFAILTMWEGATGMNVLAAFSTLMCVVLGTVVMITAWISKRMSKR